MTKVVIFVLGVNVLFTVCLGNYLEAYEGFFSALAGGIYSEPCLHDWNNDVHLFLLPVYAYVNLVFPGMQVYGLTLVLFNNIALLLVGIALYQTLDKLLDKNKFLVFMLFYGAIALENLLHLSTNRIVFYLFFGICWNYELLRMDPLKKKTLQYVLLLFLLVIACLMRYEVAILGSGLYLSACIVIRRFHRWTLLPLAISSLILFSYNFYIEHYAPEPKSVAILRELQFIDRDDIRYNVLSDSLLSEVHAFKKYNVMDDIHFRQSFYEAISINDTRFVPIRIFDGTNRESFAKIFNVSFLHAKKIWYILALLVVLATMVLFNPKNINRVVYVIVLFGIFMAPVVVCLYTLVPSRILVPYFTIILTFNILLFFYCSANRLEKYYPMVLGLLLMLVMYNVWQSRLQYLASKNTYEVNSARIEDIWSSGLCREKPCKIFINNLQFDKFFPITPYRRLTDRDMAFINFYFFASYNCSQQYWKQKGVENPLSLLEKIEYVVHTQALFISSKESLEYTMGYLQNKYQVIIRPVFIENFDNDLNIYRLSDMPASE